ncbi:hypothetical protein WN51_06241 [Melipona quadrifasciata]|uniref:Uncharacterized protein n=1 Tax=Melipona quadrifasciata TaxID=166423 RepID=A0A0M8ZSQ3_9HYME|nr:hypothetical protein WN51_06241 [Melipona quadrifasciata]
MLKKCIRWTPPSTMYEQSFDVKFASEEDSNEDSDYSNSHGFCLRDQPVKQYHPKSSAARQNPGGRTLLWKESKTRIGPDSVHPVSRRSGVFERTCDNTAGGMSLAHRPGGGISRLAGE